MEHSAPINPKHNNRLISYLEINELKIATNLDTDVMDVCFACEPIKWKRVFLLPPAYNY